MSKSFLNKEESLQAKKQLESTGYDATSHWLEQKLLAKLEQLPQWEQSGPIALGSWARGELSPKSDIDILFSGPENSVRQLVEAIHKSGLKIRHRYPEDVSNWTVGVEEFDVLALLNGKAFSTSAQKKLKEQQDKILKSNSSFRRDLLRAMAEERRSRNLRYDSVANYLEPNIKFAPGGLRDLQQALYVFDLFPEKFIGCEKIRNKLEAHKKFLLSLRLRLHLHGLVDVLVASEQKEIGQQMGFQDVRDFMRSYQRRISWVSFYADWAVERSKSSASRIKAIDSIELNTPNQAFDFLKANSSVMAQEKVHSQLVNIFSNSQAMSIGRVLRKHFHLNNSEDFFSAIFRSGLLERCIPELKRVRGLVQHDQYHRYTVNAHILQTIRNLKRVHKRKRNLGLLAGFAKDFRVADWQTLLWVALYHDLAKGRAGDHSTQGAKLVKKDFTNMGFSLRQTIEVAWMVENHLILSTAAFRRNPQASSTWSFLHNKGVKQDRLLRLAVFTAIDIKSTNPDAWNEWKEKLLFNLVETLRAKKASNFMKFLAQAEKQNIKLEKDFIRSMDTSLVEVLPLRILLRDYAALKRSKRDLEDMVWREKKAYYWFRFHRRQDRPGLFLSFAQLLFAMGCKVRESSVRTFDKYGAYDWFLVRSEKPIGQLRKLMRVMDVSKFAIPEVHFDRVSLVGEEQGEAVISFRGKDQKGALLSAAQSLYDEDLAIKWARVHTWGRQLDDVFCVSGYKNIDNLMERLKSKHEQTENEHKYYS